MNGAVTGAAELLLEVSDLIVEYPARRGQSPFRAVKGVSLAIRPGEAFGLVGESGSGKSSLCMAILGMVSPASGSIRFGGQDIGAATRRQRRELSRDLQVVFQDPYSSLNPARTIGQALAEPLEVHEKLEKREKARRISDMLDRVGLPAAAAGRYPAEFSGGQRQRIAIARALIVSPKLVICDEPVSALDLSVQAQILNLLADLQRDLSVAYLFVSHDLAVVRHLCSRVTVLYRGEVIETGSADQVYGQPSHPYTQTLVAAATVGSAHAPRSALPPHAEGHESGSSESVPPVASPADDRRNRGASLLRAMPGVHRHVSQ